MQGRRLGQLCILLALLPACPRAKEPQSAAAPAGSAAPTAEKILAKMNARYAGASSYRDQGSYRDSYRDREGNLQNARTGRFKTAWRSDGRLLFVLTDEGSSARTCAAWTSAARAQSFAAGAVTEHESLVEALGAIRGVSHGVSGLVARWLVERKVGTNDRYELRGRVACGSGECWHLQASRVGLFVDVATSALRRFTAKSEIGGGLILEDEVTFDPTFDAPVADYDLMFDPVTASSSTGRPAD